MHIGSRGIIFIHSGGLIFLIPLFLFAMNGDYQNPQPKTQQLITKSDSLIITQKENNIRTPRVAKKEEKIKPGLPIILKIPSINVNARIEYVGVTPAGAMDVPKNPINTAWYNLGPRPGEIGNAVIVGHYGSWKNGTKSVFENLNKLKKGDTLSIVDKDGINVSFVVRKIRHYDPSGSTTEVFASSDDKSHLNLITCEGTWNSALQSYSKRLVIFTDKIGK